MEKVIDLVYHWYIDNGFEIDKSQIFIVCSCYILGDSKYMVGTEIDDRFFELTYNESKNEWYINVYDYVESVTISN